MTTMKI
jgi:hypothetical protein